MVFSLLFKRLAFGTNMYLFANLPLIFVGRIQKVGSYKIQVSSLFFLERNKKTIIPNRDV
jgi:hypothetical protein